jgi:DNA-binding PadR family transcriptional regulator|tara:strand:- start:123 stop:500 length:378 start_codon:yes stop_codon:yes gene_type:complete
MSNKNEMEKFFPPEEKNVDNDYKYSRDTYYELVEKGKQSLELMIEVARESEHPRAFEVLSGMIKNISDVNDRLMDLNKKKKDLDRKEEIKNIANTTNNLFVGSTSELQKLLKNETDLVNVTPKSK